MTKKILNLYTIFLKIGTFTIGSGYAMIPLIEREVVDKRGWIDKDEFVDMIALGQSAPGPIAVDAAVFVGYKVAGVPGSIAATLGAITSSFVLLILIAAYFSGVQNSSIVVRMFKGISPAVVALIAAPAVSMGKSTKINRKTIIIPVIVVILVGFLNINPVYIIIISILLGLVYGRFFHKEEKK